MLQHFFSFFVRRTHFWRSVGFAELAELYTSRMLRVMSLQMIGGFAAVYLYQLGYGLQFIAWFFFGYFFFRACMAPLVGVTVARVGPKHGMLLSSMGQVVGAVFLASVPLFGIASLIGFMVFAGMSRSLYDVCYLVDFSKIKHVEHAGKELGIMQIIERVTTALGPLIGGVIAFFFGPEVMFIVGALLMALSAAPLFFSGEPVKVKQKITLRYFNWRVAKKPLIAQVATGIDINLSGFIWGIFLVVVVLNVEDTKVYAEIGALSSIALFASIAVAYMYGKLVDNHKGKRLLRFSVIGDVILHSIRPFVSTPLHAVAANIANEVVTTGYVLPATRGIFDTADGLPGYRIVYMTLMGTALVIGDCIAMLTLAVLLHLFSDVTAFQLVFVVLAPVLLLIMLHSTAVYRRGILTRFIHRV